MLIKDAKVEPTPTATIKRVAMMAITKNDNWNHQNSERDALPEMVSVFLRQVLIESKNVIVTSVVKVVNENMLINASSLILSESRFCLNYMRFMCNYCAIKCTTTVNKG